MFSILNAAWEVRAFAPDNPMGVTPAEKLVLVRLSDRADRNGFARPGQTSIAEECCLGVRTVRLALAALVKKGHSSIAVPHTPTQPAVYKVHPGGPPPPPAAIAARPRPNGPPKPPATTPAAIAARPRPNGPPKPPATTPAAIAGGTPATIAAHGQAAIAALPQTKEGGGPAIDSSLTGSHCRPTPAAIAGKPSDNRQEPSFGQGAKHHGNEGVAKNLFGESNEGAETKAKKPRKPNPVRDPIFDALVHAEGLAPEEVTKSAGSRIAKCVSEILEATPGCDRDEVLRRAHAYRQRWPKVTLTCTALVKHWASLGAAVAKPAEGGPKQFATLAEAKAARAARAGGDQ